MRGARWAGEGYVGETRLISCVQRAHDTKDIHGAAFFFLTLLN